MILSDKDDQMNEFSLIETYFKSPAIAYQDVIIGIGDDAACVKVPQDYELVISTDTLVADVHFLSNWDPYAIAYKAVMVNISDIAAMAATPRWASLALTIPHLQQHWLDRFSLGLHTALNQYNIALIGGDTTHGPLTITLTMHGLVPDGQHITRNGARNSDIILVSGELGAAAMAVMLPQNNNIELLNKLQRPVPRTDLILILREYATAAIDISDGLSADLKHICQASVVGAHLNSSAIPMHPLIRTLPPKQALELALTGGDDYELCFTIPASKMQEFYHCIQNDHLTCYAIGCIESEPGIRISYPDASKVNYIPKGYDHFK